MFNLYCRLKIIDDDECSFNDVTKNDDEIKFTKDDAPQIVGVIDDRPPELIANDFKNSDKWKGIVSNDYNWDKKTVEKHDLSLIRLQETTARPDSSPKLSSNLSFETGTFNKNYSPDLSPQRFRTSTCSDLFAERSADSKKKYSGDLSSERSRTFEKNYSENISSKELSLVAKKHVHTDTFQEQAVVKRDRRTGKRITLESALHESKEKNKQQEQKNHIYTRWGLG